MNKGATEYEEAVRAAERIRTLAVKAAKQSLNETIKTSYFEVIERAWNTYDAAVMAAWSACAATIEAARDGHDKVSLPQQNDDHAMVSSMSFDAALATSPAPADSVALPPNA
jgi:hypothetical protein